MTYEDLKLYYNNKGKRRIKEKFFERCEPGAVTIKLDDDKRMVISKKAYEMSHLRSIIQPEGEISSYKDDLYNNGPFETVYSFKTNIIFKTKPSISDRIKMSKMTRTIKKIRKSKDPFFDKKGKVSIKVYPDCFEKREYNVLEPSEGTITEFNKFVPKEIVTLEFIMTPRELADLGLYYGEPTLEWTEIDKDIKQNQNKGQNNLEHLKVSVDEKAPRRNLFSRKDKSIRDNETLR